MGYRLGIDVGGTFTDLVLYDDASGALTVEKVPSDYRHAPPRSPYGRDGLFREQAPEMDTRKREALLRKIQQLMHERVMFAPILEPAFLSGIGPRVEQSGFGLITGMAFTLPYEEIRLQPGRP